MSSIGDFQQVVRSGESAGLLGPWEGDLSRGSREASHHKLFVGGLSLRTTEESLHNYMSRFGSLESVHIVRRAGISRGFAFLVFSDRQTAHLVASSTHELDGRIFNCSFTVDDKDSFKKILDEKIRKLYVKGVSKKLTEEDLFHYFWQFGEVQRVTINKHTNDRYKGTAFVLFELEATVQSLLAQSCNVHLVKDKEIRIFECLTKNEIFKYMKGKRKGDHPTPLLGSHHRLQNTTSQTEIETSKYRFSATSFHDLWQGESKAAANKGYHKESFNSNRIDSLNYLSSNNLPTTQSDLCSAVPSKIHRKDPECQCALFLHKPYPTSAQTCRDCAYRNQQNRSRHELNSHNYRFNILGGDPPASNRRAGPCTTSTIPLGRDNNSSDPLSMVSRHT